MGYCDGAGYHERKMEATDSELDGRADQNPPRQLLSRSELESAEAEGGLRGIERLRLETTACDMGVRTLSLIIVLGRLGLGRRCGCGSGREEERQRLALCPKPSAPGVSTLQGSEAAMPAGGMGDEGRLLSESEEDSDEASGEKVSSGVGGDRSGDTVRGVGSVVHASKARGWK